MSKTLKKGISVALIAGALVASVGGTAFARNAGGNSSKDSNGSKDAFPGQGGGSGGPNGDTGFFDCSNAPWCP